MGASGIRGRGAPRPTCRSFDPTTGTSGTIINGRVVRFEGFASTPQRVLLEPICPCVNGEHLIRFDPTRVLLEQRSCLGLDLFVSSASTPQWVLLERSRSRSMIPPSRSLRPHNGFFWNPSFSRRLRKFSTVLRPHNGFFWNSPCPTSCRPSSSFDPTMGSSGTGDCHEPVRRSRCFDPTMGSSGTTDCVLKMMLILLRPHNGFFWNSSST